MPQLVAIAQGTLIKVEGGIPQRQSYAVSCYAVRHVCIPLLFVFAGSDSGSL